jgi:hypothetical protein
VTFNTAWLPVHVSGVREEGGPSLAQHRAGLGGVRGLRYACT